MDSLKNDEINKILLIHLNGILQNRRLFNY
nr:MAG TPA: hypothetical protein [Caudoviricetes sp.]